MILLGALLLIIDMGVVIVGGAVSAVFMGFEAIIVIGFVLMVAGAIIPDKKTTSPLALNGSQ